MTAPDVPAAIHFGPFVLDAAAARLSRDGQALNLAPRPFALLCHLAGRPGQLITKDGLLDAVWGHRHVSESALKGAMNTLRAALGDAAQSPQWIETVPRRGYRFIGAAQAAPSLAVAVAVQGVSTRADAAQAAPIHRVAAPAVPLPVAATALIGREADLQALSAQLAAHRLVTLVGSGGIGKTRLALAALQQAAAPDGVCFVALAAAADAQTLAATVARALQLSAAAAHSTDTLVAALSSLSLLLVLDSCEHLLDAVAVLAGRLLQAAPGVRLLATSQEPLAVPGEQVWRVGPLRWPGAAEAAQAESFGAVALLLARVRAQDPAFVLDDSNRVALCELCARLEGWPLALELAAARVPLLGLTGVLARLQQPLALLTHGPRDVAPRHRTLRATLEWSHSLLAPEQRCVLRRLSVFSGSLTQQAAEAVVADDTLAAWAVVDALAALIDKSLLAPLQATVPGAEPPLPPLPQLSQRLRLLDSVRSLAAEQLAAAGEVQVTRTRHAQWTLALLTDAARDLHDTPLLEWTARLQPEIDNVRAALRHALQADPALAVALYVHSVNLWWRAGLKHEAVQWQAAVRPFVTSALPAALRAGFAQSQGVLFVYGGIGAAGDVVAALDTALHLHHAEADALNEYFDLYLLSHAMVRVDADVDVDALWQWMLSLEGADWGMHRRRYARFVPAVRMRDNGDAAGFRAFCVEEIERFRAVGDRSAIWNWTYGLALAEHDAGQAQRAIELLQGVVHDIRSAGLLRSNTTIVALLASLLLEQGDPRSCLPAAREAVALLRVDGMLWWMALALPFAPLALGRPEAAARVMGWADALIERRGEPPGLLFARLRAGCEKRLQQSLAASTLQALCHEGAALDEFAALALALEPVADQAHPSGAT